VARLTYLAARTTITLGVRDVRRPMAKVRSVMKPDHKYDPNGPCRCKFCIEQTLLRMKAQGLAKRNRITHKWELTPLGEIFVRSLDR
jgi:hypothetical protein